MDVELRIPYGLTGVGNRVAPDQAEKTQTYYCPECHSPLVLKQGAINRTHFAHKVSAPECPFESEDWRHIAAKHLIYLAVMEWLCSTGETPTIVRKCAVCKRQTADSPLPTVVVDAQLERHIETKEGRLIADVALFDSNGQVKCVVEIYNTHAVDAQKRLKLIGIPWMELSAKEVLRNPLRWVVRQGRLNTFVCAKCKHAEKHALEWSSYTTSFAVQDCPKEMDKPFDSRVWKVAISRCQRCPFHRGIHLSDDTDPNKYIYCYYPYVKAHPKPRLPKKRRYWT